MNTKKNSNDSNHSNSSKPSNEKAPKAKKSSWLELVFLWGFLSVCLVFAGLLVAVLWTYPRLPDTAVLANYRPKQPLRVFTIDGVEIGGFGTEQRIYQPINEIPQLMKDSLLAVEDARFYEHQGVDPIGILRAIVSNLTGGRKQGASTITQQVARTFLLTRARTFDRKFKEALLSIKIERELTKDKILELYMNQIYLGSRAYGFEAASQIYFGKPLKALNVAESAMLAGLPQNPHNANPIRNFERSRTRQMVVLGRMLSQKVITQEQYEAAKAHKLAIRKGGDLDVNAEYAAEMVRQQVYAQYGEEAYTRGLRVTTTLSSEEQRAAWQALRKGVIDYELRQSWRGAEDLVALPDQAADSDPAITQPLAEMDDDDDLRLAVLTRVNNTSATAVLASGEVINLDNAGLRQAKAGLNAQTKSQQKLQRGSVVRLFKQNNNWVLTQWPEIEAAIVSLNPQNGQIQAMVGGFDFRRNQFNHVTQGWRQPGSSLKPFLYSAAFEYGIMPETLVNDAPFTDLGSWNPKNADGKAEGFMSLRQALAKSKNLVTLRLVRYVGLDHARDWLSQFGFDEDKHPHNLTLALGAGSTTPLQLAAAYGVIANGGHYLNPQLIARVTDVDGKAVYEASTQALEERNRMISERNAFLTSSLLRDVIQSGTAARAQALKRNDLYGKTGTTNDSFDAWFAGFQPSRVAVVWLGYDTPQSLGAQASGSSLALPIWVDFMRQALKKTPVQLLAEPEDGVQKNDSDWRYSEWANGGFVTQLDLEVYADRATSTDVNSSPLKPLESILMNPNSHPNNANNPNQNPNAAKSETPHLNPNPSNVPAAPAQSSPFDFLRRSPPSDKPHSIGAQPG